MNNKAAQTPKPRVLLVDDDVDQLALCSRWLTLSGYQVDSAPGGTEALASLERTRPDRWSPTWSWTAWTGCIF
jgi:CheY-like chemotaxis protein